MKKRKPPVLGILEWFQLGEHQRVERVLDELRALGVQHLRTGVSWADWMTPHGEAWYEWLLPRLAEEVEVLPCFVYTPPSLGIEPRAAAPPRDPKAFADFLDVVITRFGEHFDTVELWNEPNNLSEWDWSLDPQWEIYGRMMGGAAYWAHQRGKRTVLGGMSPPDANWLGLMCQRGVIEQIDVVGLHGFPGTWEHAWTGWDRIVEEMQQTLAHYGQSAELWITEVGFSTWRHDEIGMLETFRDALEAPVERVYWYSAHDLHPDRSAVDGFHSDERDYHFGLKTHAGEAKLLSRLWSDGGPQRVRDTLALAHSAPARDERGYTLITGGAGFVGTNLAARLLEDGERVLVYDSLARAGVEDNLRWLADTYGDRLLIEVGDVRDRYRLRSAVTGADAVFHLAAQVAVTTSLTGPLHDFEVNAAGTLTLLEELRRRDRRVPVVFTSTNKVYGDLADIELELDGTRYQPADPAIAASGVSEARPLAFHSPYGCSKGAADQYVLDYAHTFGLPATVFRMSCIYGPHQHGTEDQGWVAHFVIRALRGEPITLYGDGCQVRDILFVDDLVEAFLAAREQMSDLAGQAFNIGGGPGQATSLIELLNRLEGLLGRPTEIRFGDWRRGDQRYYVSNTQRFRSATGWRPRVGVDAGVERLTEWLRKRHGVDAPRTAAKAPTRAK